MDYNPNLIGKKIRELRESKNMTQGELAKIVGCKQNNVSSIETGVNHGSRMDTICIIADYFKVSLDEIFEESLLVYKNEITEVLDRKILNELNVMTNESDLSLALEIFECYLKSIESDEY